jgi:hypothetical protein
LLQPSIDSAHLVIKNLSPHNTEPVAISSAPSANSGTEHPARYTKIQEMPSSQTTVRGQTTLIGGRLALEIKPGMLRGKTIFPRFTPTSHKASTKFLPLTIHNLSSTKYPKEDLRISLRNSCSTLPYMSSPSELATAALTSPEDPIPIDLRNGIRLKRISFPPDIKSPELTGNRPELVR